MLGQEQCESLQSGGVLTLFRDRQAARRTKQMNRVAFDGGSDMYLGFSNVIVEDW